jgi:hypothetical protein
MLIGLLPVQIALGARGKQADSLGARHEAADQRGGIIILWLLMAASAGLALWRLAEAAYGQPGPRGHTSAKRLQSPGYAIWGLVLLVSGNSASRDGARFFLADSPQAGTTPIRLPSESLNHAASPPPGI